MIVKIKILLVLNFITLDILLILLNVLLIINSNIIYENVQIISNMYSYFALAYIILVTLNLQKFDF